jgi:hypothetical protein
MLSSLTACDRREHLAHFIGTLRFSDLRDALCRIGHDSFLPG